MRLDTVPEGFLENVASAFGLLPESVVRVVWGFTVARTLLAAVELGVFPALGDGEHGSDELAKTLGCDQAGMRTLLDGLTGFGVVKRRRGRYRLGKEGRRYLTGTGPGDFTPAMRMGALLDRKFAGLAEAVRTGRRADFHVGLTDDEWRDYLEGLGALAGVVASEVVRKVRLRAPKRMLDVAGGHGRFTVAFLERHEVLEAEILDLEGAVRVGRPLVAKTEVRDRVTFRVGDLRTSDWGEGYDLVLLFNILHNLEERDAKQAVASARAALSPGGRLLVLDGQHAGGQGDLDFQAGFGELFFWMLSASETWPEPTLRAWVERAGFTQVKRRRLLTLPGSVLLEATAP